MPEPQARGMTASQDTPAHENRSVINARGTASVAVSSVIAALTSFVVFYMASQTLTIAENSDFLAFWSFLFMCFATLAGLQQEAIRSVGAAEIHGHGSVRVLRSGLVIGVACAAVLALTAILWAPKLFPGSQVLSTTVTVVAIIAYAGHCASAGALAGRHRWTTYSGLVTAEAILRTAAVVAAALLGLALGGFEIAVGVGATAWLGFLIAPRVRATIMSHGDSTPAVFYRRAGQAMVAALASAVIVVGFPTFLRLTSSADEWSTSAPLTLAITLTRAPIMMPLTAFQGVAITFFLAHKTRGINALARISGIIIGVGIIGAIAAALVGPTLLRLFNSNYTLPPLVFGLLTLGAAALALLTLTGSATLALNDHRWYLAGWVTASAVALGILLIPVPLDIRAVLALLTGPIIGVLVHARAIQLHTHADDEPGMATTPQINDPRMSEKGTDNA